MEEGKPFEGMIVSDDEILNRAFSAPSCIDENWRPRPHMFLLNASRGEEDVSLSRESFETISSFIKRSLSFRWRWMSKKDKPAGVASLVAKDIRSLDQHIELQGPTSPAHIFHAGIVFKLSDGEKYHPVKNTVLPEDVDILGYRTLLANTVRIVYDTDQEVKWRKED